MGGRSGWWNVGWPGNPPLLPAPPGQLAAGGPGPAPLLLPPSAEPDSGCGDQPRLALPVAPHAVSCL